MALPPKRAKALGSVADVVVEVEGVVGLGVVVVGTSAFPLQPDAPATTVSSKPAAEARPLRRFVVGRIMPVTIGGVRQTNRDKPAAAV